MTGTSFVARISLPLLCVLAVTTEAGAMRPASPAAPSPQSGTTATTGPGFRDCTLDYLIIGK